MSMGGGPPPDPPPLDLRLRMFLSDRTPPDFSNLWLRIPPRDRTLRDFLNFLYDSRTIFHVPTLSLNAWFYNSLIGTVGQSISGVTGQEALTRQREDVRAHYIELATQESRLSGLHVFFPPQKGLMRSLPSVSEI